MIKQCFIILGCLALGHLIVWATEMPLPSGIVGLLLLTIFLQCKIVKLEDVKDISDFLIRYMGFFFVPPGVALMIYFDIIKAEILPITIATVASTVLVLVSTGWTYHFFKKNKIKKTFISKIHKK